MINIVFLIYHCNYQNSDLMEYQRIKNICHKKYDMDSIPYYSLFANFYIQQCITTLIVHLYARFSSQSPSGSVQRKARF